MLVWSGRGIFSIIILVTTFLLSNYIIPTENGDYRFIVSTFVTGLFSWYFGKKWNIKNQRVVTNKKTGQRLIIKNNHTIFWIPMQYWGIIFSVVGTIILFQNSVTFGTVATIILVAFILIPLITQRSKSLNESKTIEKKNLEPNSNKKKTQNSNEIITELKKESSTNKEFDPSDHSRFMPK